MIAELHIYGNPSSPDPTKVYTVYKLTPYLKGQIQDFILKKFEKEELKKLSGASSETIHTAVTEKYDDVSEEEIKQDLIRLLRLFFPEITLEEIMQCDFGDETGTNGQLYEFLNKISFYANKEEAIKTLNLLKENKSKVRVISQIDSLLDDFSEPFYSLDELRVYCLTANPID